MKSLAVAIPGLPEPEPFRPVEIVSGDPSGRLALLCDHATNRLPAAYGTLGLPRAELDRHIAYDIGAAALTQALAARFKATAVLAGFSRLLIDPNRGEDDPTLIMRLSDRAIVPGNAVVGADERARRIAAFYQPYHAAIDTVLSAKLARGIVPIVLSVHSFTPQWRGARRPWHAGLLWDADPRVARALISGLAAESALVVGDNQPYSGDLRNDTLFRHATVRGLPHALIEVRQDLIDDEAGVQAWADRLEPIISGLEADPDLAVIRHYGSRTGPVAPMEVQIE